MQMATAQRTLTPTFKDGLSALSYGQPHPNHSQGLAADAMDPHHDDEPMPIPSTWREPAAREKDRWFRQQMGAAALGLAAGLMIVVPTVLWLSGWIGAGQKQKVASSAASATMVDLPKPIEMKTVKTQVRPIESAAQFATGSIETNGPAESVRQKEVATAATIATAKVPDTRGRIEELLTTAQRRIEGGDIAGARELLASSEVQSLGAGSFALAETYDPNMLAAWGRREAVADVDKARSLYDKALKLGVSRAQVRLDGLQ
jgi:hypothetical protein